MMLRGSLENIGLVFIALLSAELKTTSWLRLIHGQVSAELAFQYDRVVWAAFGNQRGLPALDAVVLGLGKADFLLEEGPAPREQNLSLTVGELRAPGVPRCACAAPRCRSDDRSRRQCVP